jgi:hypothetical protein
MTRKIRIWVLLALLVVGATSLFALPPNEVTWEYYSDSSFSTLCGEKILFCSGYVWKWGCQTSYYYTWSYPC